MVSKSLVRHLQVDIKREQPDSSGRGWRGRGEEAVPEAARWTAEATALRARQPVRAQGEDPGTSRDPIEVPPRFFF